MNLSVPPNILNSNLVFIDTEFGSFESLNILSVGAVLAGSGETFYRELSDPASPHLCSDFVLKNVLPLFDGGEYYQTSNDSIEGFFAWIQSLPDKPTYFISDAPSYEKEVFVRWGKRHEIDWKARLGKPLQFCTFSLFSDFELSDFECELGRPYKEHHALDDAKLNVYAFNKMGGDIILTNF